ncbi:hypothetical protein L9F63_023442, partial [Diploptera punctata]
SQIKLFKFYNCENMPQAEEVLKNSVIIFDDIIVMNGVYSFFKYLKNAQLPLDGTGNYSVKAKLLQIQIKKMENNRVKLRTEKKLKKFYRRLSNL